MGTVSFASVQIRRSRTAFGISRWTAAISHGILVRVLACSSWNRKRRSECRGKLGRILAPDGRHIRTTVQSILRRILACHHSGRRWSPASLLKDDCLKGHIIMPSLDVEVMASEILVGHVSLCYTHGNNQNQDEIHPVNSN